MVAGPAGGCKPGRWPGVRLGLPDCAPARRMDGLARGARLRCGSRTGGEKSGGFRSVPAPSQKRRLRDRPLWSRTIATGREIRWRRTDRGFVLKPFGLRPATSRSDEKRPETTPTSPLIHRFEIYFGGRVAFTLGHAHQERGVGGDGEGASFVGVEVGVVDHEQAAGRERGRGCGEERGPGGIHNEPSGRRERPSNSGPTVLLTVRQADFKSGGRG